MHARVLAAGAEIVEGLVDRDFIARAGLVDRDRLIQDARSTNATTAPTARRMWIAPRGQGEEVGRGRVQRLMKQAGIRVQSGAGSPWCTTKPDPKAGRRPDPVKRDFTVGEAYDNAMAESFVDTFKTDLIADRIWRSRSQLELVVVEYVSWFNHQRLHESLGDIAPVEFESLYVRQWAQLRIPS